MKTLDKVTPGNVMFVIIVAVLAVIAFGLFLDGYKTKQVLKAVATQQSHSR